MRMTTPFQPVFARLRQVLQKHSGAFRIAHDTAEHFSLDAAVGPATLRAWRGKQKSPTIPVAWVQIGKSHVSYHLMGVSGNPKLLEECSAKLRARMQGKSCFNFTEIDESLIEELDRLTIRSLTGMRKAGYIANDTVA